MNAASIEPDLQTRRVRLASGLMLIAPLILLSSLWGVGAGPPLSDHEAIPAQVARQTRESGHWLIPTYNNVSYIRKPPLQTWLASLASYVVDPPDLAAPVSELAARLPSALAGIGTVLVILLLGRQMLRARTGLVAGLILLSCGGYLGFARNAQPEMLMTFFITAALACFWAAYRFRKDRRWYMAGFCLSLGLGMMTKAPLPLVLVGLPVAVYWLAVLPCSRVLGSSRPLAHIGLESWAQLLKLRSFWTWTGVAVFLVLTLAWPLYAYSAVPGALKLWRIEFLDRYTGQIGREAKPFWYYFPLLFGIAVPFTLSVPEALASPFLDVYRRHRAALLFVLTWLLAQLIFLSTSPFKRPHYIVPILPPLALLLAPAIDRLFFGLPAPSRAKVRIACAAILLVLLAAIAPAWIFAIKPYKSIAWMAWQSIALGLLGVAVTSLLFIANYRTQSFAALVLTSLLVFNWAWIQIGRSDFTREEVEFADKLREHGITKDDRIVWAVGRPDAAIAFYGNRRIEPLFSELEMAERRRGRLDVPQSVIDEGLERIETFLASPEPVYIVLSLEQAQMMRSFGVKTGTEVFRLRMDEADPDEILCVITGGLARSGPST